MKLTTTHGDIDHTQLEREVWLEERYNSWVVVEKWRMVDHTLDCPTCQGAKHQMDHAGRVIVRESAFVAMKATPFIAGDIGNVNKVKIDVPDVIERPNIFKRAWQRVAGQKG